MAFYNCAKLTSVTIPDSVSEIGIRAFSNCKSLVSVHIPAGVVKIGDGAFGSCESLTGISVSPDNPAFSSKDGLLFDKTGTVLLAVPASKQGEFSIPAGVTKIGESAFMYCDGLVSIELPEGIREIACDTFYDCTKLESVHIPDSVTEIGEGAFKFCEKLRSVEWYAGPFVSPVPNSSLTAVGKDAFWGCDCLNDATRATIRGRFGKEALGEE